MSELKRYDFRIAKIYGIAQGAEAFEDALGRYALYTDAQAYAQAAFQRGVEQGRREGALAAMEHVCKAEGDTFNWSWPRTRRAQQIAVILAALPPAGTQEKG